MSLVVVRQPSGLSNGFEIHDLVKVKPLLQEPLQLVEKLLKGVLAQPEGLEEKPTRYSRLAADQPGGGSNTLLVDRDRVVVVLEGQRKDGCLVGFENKLLDSLGRLNRSVTDGSDISLKGLAPTDSG